jgi:hypothetical protein
MLQLVALLHQDRRLLSIQAAMEGLLGVGSRPDVAETTL